MLEVPEPSLSPDGVLVEMRASLVSAGTERSKIAVGQKSLIGKARARPDQARQVIEKARRDGLRETIDAVRSKLEEPSPLGYSAAGTVLAVGSRVRDLVAGDRVACGGAGAAHAEIGCVPGNLCVRLPGGVDFEAGAFATLGSVALHGVRQADVRIGERVAVIGLGLLGQLTGQILRAGGCQVAGVDLSRDLVELAIETGAADVGYERGELVRRVPHDASQCDAVIITAATSSSDPLELAPELCRDRGRVVLVGDVHIEFSRAPYYEKELELKLSRSYGPGRYDREYEERGLDYPIGYVRWTERRNMAAFLELVGRGAVNVSALVTERYPIASAPAAYHRLAEPGVSPLGIILEYPNAGERPRKSTSGLDRPPATSNPLVAGVIGSGSFASRVLVPALRDAGFHLRAVASAGGLSAQAVAQRFGFDHAVTPDELLADPELGVVAVATRHDSHASLAISALEAGKAVFVEKPPALDERELARLVDATETSGLPLAVGFNRRFAPLAVALREHVRGGGDPIQLLYRINAEPLEDGHWLNDPLEGGGRLVGEGCHFVDFACWLVGGLPVSVFGFGERVHDGSLSSTQTFTIALQYANGSLATIQYGSSGASGVPKEYVEAHAGGRSAILHDFRSLDLFEGRKRRRQHNRAGDKGHGAQFRHFRLLVEGRAEPDAPTPLETMAVTLASGRSFLSGDVIRPTYRGVDDDV